MDGLVARFDARPSRWLLLGGALVALTQISHPLGALAWAAPLPWLRYVRQTSGRRRWIALLAAQAAAWTLAVVKIASEPHLVLLAPLFALPIALAHALVLAAWSVFVRRAGALASAAFYALALAGIEVAIDSRTELGSWGAIGYTQLDDILLVQSASLVGLAGVGAIVSFVGAAAEAYLATRDPRRARPLALALGIALAAHGFGAARLWLAPTARLLPVAMVGTDSDVSGPPLPDRETTHRWDAASLARTRAAAAGGAELVVWTEASALVWPDEEAAWLAAVIAAARESGVDVVAAYVVPVGGSTFRYRNELRLVHRDGRVEDAYGKRHPVPGEPSIAGTADGVFYAMPWGTLSAAICYDYDFPAIARSRRGAGIVAVPASDWRGIDPVHAEMAAVRAIESGHSLVRSTRFGLSIAVDAYGRVRASRSAFDGGAPITYALVPFEPVGTLYGTLGDAPLLALLALVTAAGLWRRARPGALAPRT